MVIFYDGPFNKLFYDATLVVVFFTTLANGIVAKPLVTALGLKAKEGEKTDYGEYYDYANYKPGALAKGWKWIEDNLICKYIIKENALHEAIVKEIIEEEKKEAYKKVMYESNNK